MCHIESAAELANYNGASIVPRLVNWDDKCWYQKPGSSWQELLAHRLGDSWLNVADAVRPTVAAGAIYSNGTPFDAVGDAASCLVRVIQDYKLDELAERDLDKAVASELIFSLWVRRRDTHAWNRAYVDGIPGFFDHHVAFGEDATSRSLEGFFRDGGDAGYAGRWRTWELGEGEVPTTVSERGLAPVSGLAIHRVRSLECFDKHLDVVAQHIASFDEKELKTLATDAGAPEPQSVAQLLVQTRDELPKALTRLRQIVYQ
jgi:hypothetical protein